MNVRVVAALLQDRRKVPTAISTSVMRTLPEHCANQCVIR